VCCEHLESPRGLVGCGSLWASPCSVLGVASLDDATAPFSPTPLRMGRAIVVTLTNTVWPVFCAPHGRGAHSDVDNDTHDKNDA
jgi:hypothetical protein